MERVSLSEVMDATSILTEVARTALELRVAERAVDKEEDIDKIREVYDRFSECLKAHRAALAKVMP